MKLFKYAKPYILSIIVSIIFLFIQANADLALPDYMSRIVNVGIQQGGIEEKFPKAMGNNLIYAMMPLLGANADVVSKSYEKIDQNHEKYETFLATYPELENEPVFLLKDDSIENLEKISDDFSRVFLFASFMINPPTNMPDLPEEALTGKNSTISDNTAPQTGFPSFSEELVSQASVQMIRREYQRLGMDMNAIQNRYILKNGAIMLGLTLLSVGAAIFVVYIASKVSAGITRSIRRDVFRKVESFTNAEFDKIPTASLITRSTNDVTQLQRVIFMMIRIMAFAPILGIGGIMRAMAKAPSMAWLIGLAVLLLLGLVVFVVLVALPRFKLMQKLTDRMNLVARENLSGLLVVRSFNRQGFEEVRFDEANQDLTKNNIFIMRVMVLMMPLIMIIMNLLSVAIIWIGSHQIAEAQMQVGDMMAFLQYAMQIVMSFMMLSMMFIMLPRAGVSANRINEVLETEVSITDPKDPADMPSHPKGLIEFRDVCFKYPGGEENALENISFVAEPGKTTAIIGATGSGKTTLLNLIPRFYDINCGELLFDGIPISDLKQSDLRSQIGYVPQKSTLFSGTVESNLRYGHEDVPFAAVQDAAETAQAMDFILEKEEGYGADIAQGGSNVSGGQKQRLSIARALVQEYPVLLFDDSFSALDFRTDAALRKALHEKTGDATILIVAQRVSTIMKADQIIVLDNGRIVGMGTHNELLESCEAYKEIALSQLSMKELA